MADMDNIDAGDFAAEMSMERAREDRHDDLERMKHNESKVVNHTTILKLDFDGSEKTYRRRIKKMKAVLNIIGLLKLTKVKVMQTKKGFHTYLYVQSPKFKIQSMDIVALQSLLCSDWKRESFNFIRVVSSRGNRRLLSEGWNVLFESKWKTKLGEPLSKEVERPDLVKLFFTKHQ